MRMSWRVATLGMMVGASVLAFSSALRADDLETGITLYQQGKYAEAEGHLRKAAGAGADASAYLAASLARQKKFGEGETTAKAVLKDSPTHEVALAALGESLVGQKKYDEAVDLLGVAIKAKPDLAYAYYWRGYAYYSKKQPDRMVADFETFLKLQPKAPEAATLQQLLTGLK